MPRDLPRYVPPDQRPPATGLIAIPEGLIFWLRIWNHFWIYAALCTGLAMAMHSLDHIMVYNYSTDLIMKVRIFGTTCAHLVSREAGAGSQIPNANLESIQLLGAGLLWSAALYAIWVRKDRPISLRIFLAGALITGAVAALPQCLMRDPNRILVRMDFQISPDTEMNTAKVRLEKLQLETALASLGKQRLRQLNDSELEPCDSLIVYVVPEANADCSVRASLTLNAGLTPVQRETFLAFYGQYTAVTLARDLYPGKVIVPDNYLVSTRGYWQEWYAAWGIEQLKAQIVECHLEPLPKCPESR